MSAEPTAPPVKPEFATNRDGKTVGAAIARHLQYVLDTWAKGFDVAIATAYFNPGGFGLLADQLEAVDGVRLLLGAEPESRLAGPRPLKQAKLPQQAYAASLRDALAGHERDIKQDLDLLGFQPDTDKSAQRLIEWLRSGKVQVRRFTKGFLHGKAFLVTTDHEGVIAGSANFTYAGLTLNQELTLGHYQPAVVAQVAEWFEDLWDQAEDYDLAAVYEQRFRPHEPYLVYLRMLYERYGAEVEEEARGLRTGMRLTQFQEDGVWRAQRILEEHHGVVVADGVGLGKTFIAGAIIKQYSEQLRQRVLVVAPAALRDGPWASFMRRYDLPRGVQCVSYDQLLTDRQLRADGTQRVLEYEIDDYGLIVIDEAHGFRNPETLRAEALRGLLSGSPPKAVVMLTATPVNNGLFDLYHLLSYFIRNDAAFAHAGIRSLREHFAQATAENPEDLSPDRLFDVLDAVAVRRTRRFVKTYYARDRLIDNQGNAIQITFPAVKVEKVGYDLDELMPGFFARLAHALDPDSDHAHGVPDGTPTLTLARYSPSRYLRAGGQDAYELQLAGLLRSGLLKRFESSAHAFALTCRRMADSHDKFLALMDHGRVATGAALADWAAPEDDEFDEIGIEIPEDSEPLALYRVEELRADVEADRDLLRAFAAEAEQLTADQDPKLAALVEHLADDRPAGHQRGELRRGRARQAQGHRLLLLHRHGRVDRRPPRRRDRGRRAARRLPRAHDDDRRLGDQGQDARPVRLRAEVQRSARAPRRGPVRPARRHRRARRGRQPPAGSPHHQLRPAVESDAAGSAPRAHRPHRLLPRPQLRPLLLSRHQARRDPRSGRAPQAQAPPGRGCRRRRAGGAAWQPRLGERLQRDTRRDRAHP